MHEFDIFLSKPYPHSLEIQNMVLVIS